MKKVFAQADQFISTNDCLDNIAGATGCEGSLKTVIVAGIDWALGFVGLIGIIAIIYAGFLYLTSGGDDAQAQTARKVILYTIIGIIIILMSYTIVSAILGAFSGDAAA